MLKNRIVQATAVAVTSAGLIMGLSGIAGAATNTSSIDTTGPHSSNTVHNNSSNNVNVDNTNHLTLSAYNSQSSSTGNARTTDNTSGGGATSGMATNDNTVDGTVAVTNSMPDVTTSDPGGASFDGTVTDTGPFSTNQLNNTDKNTLTVTNDNTICLTTTNDQSAVSGNATVSDNTHGGDATTGDASNTSSSTFSITVSN